MRNNTPETLYQLAQSMNPGVPVRWMTKKPTEEKLDIHRWLNTLEEAGMLNVPFTDPLWSGSEITFHYLDASYLHIKF